MSMSDALVRTIELAGGQSALARRLNVKPQAVQQWWQAGKVPPKRVLDAEAATNGQVTRYQLRPDIYGEAPPEASTAPPSSDVDERGAIVN